jgi:hypothetical protein
MSKLKKYQIVIESNCRTIVEVEAADEDAARELAMEGEYELIDVDHGDSEVTEVREI